MKGERPIGKQSKQCLCNGIQVIRRKIKKLMARSRVQEDGVRWRAEADPVEIATKGYTLRCGHYTEMSGDWTGTIWLG